MIYLFENQNNDTSIVFDEGTLTEKDKVKGIAIESLPLKENIEGKIAILKCRKSTNEVWYEYIDIVPSTMETRMVNIEIAIANMMGV
ncbi:MAG: hypothetical protein RSA29_04355 [Clostridium sp.]|uniref:hypothetical protein n=1 Tax=Clostridium sp. TaxID=1506 RepID=UPI00306CA1F3